MPAPKKHPSLRAGRAAVSRATLTRDKPKTPVPPLPERKAGWHPLTVEMWNDIWASPMSDEWDASDVNNVYVLAAIFDDVWTATSPKARREASAEFRLQRVDLGLSPYSRRRLEWTIESADEAKAKGQQRRRTAAPAPTKDAGLDPRADLRAV